MILAKNVSSTGVLGKAIQRRLVDEEEYRLIDYNFDMKNRYILLIIPNELHIYSLDQDWEMAMPFPWAKEDLPNIQVSIYGNRIFLVDGRHPMQELVRLGRTSFSLAPFVFKVPPQKETNFKVSIIAVQTIGQYSARLWLGGTKGQKCYIPLKLQT